MALSERPQERLVRLGPAALSDAELLAMLLRSGTQGHDVLTLSHQLIQQAGSLAALISWRPEDFRAIKGIGPVKALQLITVMEVARRVLVQQGADSPILATPQEISHYMRPYSLGLEVEKLWVLSLNRRNRLIKCREVSSGTATSSLVHPREVYREAIREGATAIVCVHNHPSGDPSPSAADVRATRQLRESAAIIKIDLLDHVILGQAANDPQGVGYYSFAEAGLI